jgi:peptidyl-prolyl cis-trans isomerase D
MLEALRKSVSGVLAKILIGLLIVSFAVWGIGDMVRSYGRDVVAQVGDRSISAGEFRQAYQIQVSNFSQQFGRRLTPQEAKVLGIEGQVIQRLTGAAAVDNHTDDLGLDISPKAVERDITTDPTFQGPDGKFSAIRLEDILRRSGYSEAQYVAARKRDTIREQLTDSMLSNVTPPDALKSMIRTYQGEERVVSYVEVKPDKVVTLPEPDEDALKKTYETNKRDFMVPEYRKFEALLLTRDAAKKQLDISEEELKSAYEAEKAAYVLPEQRRIQQIAFADKTAAEKALAEIRAGKDFLEVAKANGSSEKDVNLGLLTQSAMIDPEIAKAAFALEKDKVSDVVEGQLTTVLLRVTEVKESRQRPFEDVKDQIRDEIASQRVGDKMIELQNAIDDNRLAGKSLKEISETLGLPFVAVDATDRQGQTPDGKKALQNSDATSLINTAFRAEVGVENEVIELANDGLAWLNLIAVTPEKQKEFDAVRDEVAKVWRQNETKEKLREAAEKLAENVNAGATLKAIATKLGTDVKTTPKFKRRDSVPDFSPAAVKRAFALPKGRAAMAEGTASDGIPPRLVLKVVEVHPPVKAGEAEAKALNEELFNALSADVIEQYVAALRQDMDISVNQQLIDQTTGASAAVN